MTFGWVLEGGGWLVRDTLEEVKDLWSFGKIVFEIDSEDEESLMNYSKEVKSNRLTLEKLKEKYSIVYQENEPPEYLVRK